jgi:hypothetical protein
MTSKRCVCACWSGWSFLGAVVLLLLLGVRVDETSIKRDAVRTVVRGGLGAGAGRERPAKYSRAGDSASDAGARTQAYSLQSLAATELADQPAERGGRVGMQSCFDSTLPSEFTSHVSPLTLEQKMALHKSISWAPIAGTDALAMLRPKELRLIGQTPANISKWKKCDKSTHDMPTAHIGDQCGCGSTEFTNRPIQYPHRVLRDNRPAAKLVRALHGRTLCLVGDSFDKQIFFSLRNALERLKDNGTTACDSNGEMAASSQE